MATPNQKPQYTQQELESEFQRRIAAHQAEIAARRTVAFDKLTNPPLNLLCNGDSWFDYLPRKYKILAETDVIFELKNTIGSPQPACLNLAVAGDATTQSLGLSRQQKMIEAIQTPANGSFDAILFSGGGDDLAGEQFCIWLDDASVVNNDPTQALNAARFSELLAVIRSAFESLVQLRDEHLPNAPIVVHGYDYPQRLGVPVSVAVCTLGPWLAPSLTFRGWTTLKDQTDIAGQAIRLFNDMLSQFAKDHPKVIYIDTPGTLAGASDWDNELHPTKGGFKKIAQKFATALRTTFPGRI